MGKRCDPWFRMSGYADSDTRIVRAGPMAEVLFYRILMYCCRNRSDGIVPAERMHEVGSRVTRLKQRVDTLLALGLLQHDTETAEYRVPNWLKWNDSQQAISAGRARDTSRKRSDKSQPVRPDSGRTGEPIPVPRLDKSREPTESSPPLKGRGGEDSSGGVRPRDARGAARTPDDRPQWQRDLAERAQRPGKPPETELAEVKALLAAGSRAMRARENRRAGALDELRRLTPGATSTPGPPNEGGVA